MKIFEKVERAMMVFGFVAALLFTILSAWVLVSPVEGYALLPAAGKAAIWLSLVLSGGGAVYFGLIIVETVGGLKRFAPRAARFDVVLTAHNLT